MRNRSGCRYRPTSSFTCALCEAQPQRFERYIDTPVKREEIGSDHIVIVNSLPKSGSIWVVAMLRHLLRLDIDDNPRVLHVADVWDAAKNGPVFGVVVLVRDLRDVVLSWHDETIRNDARAGFLRPRYPTVEAFYFEHLIGFLQSERRYKYGRLTDWIDLMTARGFPLIRYEDMRRDPSEALRKIMTFWKVIASDKEIRATVEALEFDKMREAAEAMGGMIGEAVANGHLHRGEVGRWKDELPEPVLADIARRFGDFQARLGYS